MSVAAGRASDADALSVTFGALADPTRRAILARLAEGEATVNELAALFPGDLAAGRQQAPQGARARRAGDARPQRPAAAGAPAGAPLADVTAWLEHYRHFYEGIAGPARRAPRPVAGADPTDDPDPEGT